MLFPVMQLQDPASFLFYDLCYVAVRIQSLIVPQDTDKSGIDGKRTDRTEHGFLEFLLGSQSGLLHDGIHPAAHEIDVREPLLQSGKNICGICADKVVQAYQKDRRCTGAVGKTPYDIRYTLDRDRFQISVVEIVLLDQDAGKAVRSCHLRSGQDNAAHAVVRTYINLVALGDQEADMDNVPGAVYRGVELQAVGKRHWEFRVCDPHCSVLFIHI